MHIAANELLRYRPIDDLYEEWLDRVAELVRAAGGSPASSFLLHRAPPCAGKEAPGAPQPPPPQEGTLAPRRVALGGTRSIRRQRGKSRAAKKSLACKKLPGRSLLQHVATMFLLPHVKTPRCSQLQRVGTCKTKLSVTQGLPWPQRAAAPSPPS